MGWAFNGTMFLAAPLACVTTLNRLGTRLAICGASSLMAAVCVAEIGAVAKPHKTSIWAFLVVPRLTTSRVSLSSVGGGPKLHGAVTSALLATVATLIIP